MKKMIPFLLLTGVLFTSNPILKTQSVSADSEYTVYHNADLGLPSYGSTLTYYGPQDNTYTYVGANLSAKSELQLSYKNGVNDNTANYWLAVGGYGVYVSASSTIRFLYLIPNYGSAAGDYARGVEIRDLQMKSEAGVALTSLMPGGYIFNDYIDATLRFDLTGSKAVVEFFVEYKGVTYYPYSGEVKKSIVTYSNVSQITDTKFRMATATSASCGIISFKEQTPVAPSDKLINFTNNEFALNITSSGSALLSESEAASASVPSGYSGSVLTLTSTTNNSVFIDYRDLKLPLNLINNINFRMYAHATPSGNYPEFRLKPYEYVGRENEVNMWPIKSTGGGGISLVSTLDQWITISVNTDTITDNREWLNFACIKDKTLLGAFELFFRCANYSDVLYIDSITLDLKNNDGVGPVISYNGSETVAVAAGASLNINATAYDAADARNVEITRTWIGTEPTFNLEGKITSLGTFTLQLSATDFFGNTTTKNITVKVIEPDTTYPEINVPFDELTLPVGTYFDFDPERYVYDYNLASLSVDYSDGARDAGYRLLEGTHTMTIVAKDTSENTTTKDITLHVVSNYTPSGDVTDEEKLFGDYSVVVEFVTIYLKRDLISTDDRSSTQDCASNYAAAKEAYSHLTSNQKDIFLTNDDFAEMVTRFNAWAAANGETIDEVTQQIVPLASRYLESGTAIYLALVVGAFSIGLFTLLLVTKKRKNRAK